MKATMPKHIAILLTCVDPEDYAKQFPDDGEKFRQLLQPFRPDWTFTTVPVKDNVFPEQPEQYNGYVVTGSPKSVNDSDAWIERLMDFIRQVEARKLPLFGACFGHQAIAKALGGKVEKSNKGWGLGIAPTHFTSHLPSGLVTARVKPESSANSDGLRPSMCTAAAIAVPGLQITSTRLPSKSSRSLSAFQSTSLPTS